MLIAEQNFDFEIICKYFSGAKDSRYGDLQSLRPVFCVPQAIPGKFSITTQNDFINITLDDNYLLRRLLDYSQTSFELSLAPTGTFNDRQITSLAAEYLLYLFNIYVVEIWQESKHSVANYPCAAEWDGCREPAVMAFFLIESLKQYKKDPSSDESFKKLYEIFVRKLYFALHEKALKNTSAALKLLTACALKLSINIPAYREA